MRTTILTLAIVLLTSTYALGQKKSPKCENRPDGDHCGSVTPLSATGPTSSPIAPRDPNDTRFVENGGSGLDTGCTFRPEGPLVIQAPITRVVGATNSDGTLQFAQQLVNNGLLSEKVTVRMPAFDVDLAGAPGLPPELDHVLFNGVNVGSLSGSNNTWKLNEFEVPVSLVRFGTRGANGSDPTPGNNEITILIDQGSGSDINWCTAIDWVELSFKAVSPIILVHGNGQSGQFFVQEGFTSYLDSQKLLYDLSIHLPKDEIYNNATEINKKLPDIVKSFGVDSIHIVAHSKGGADVRGYLEAHQPDNDKKFKVLSLNTLSTPHDGSMLADLLEERKSAAKLVGITGRIEFEGFPDWTRQMVAIVPFDKGLQELTTKKMGTFNAKNVGAVRNVDFSTVGADADLNENGQIDRIPDEYAGARRFMPSILVDTGTQSNNPSRFVIDSIYQILRNTANIRLECCRTEGILRRRVATIRSVPSEIIIFNDVLVPGASAIGAESILPISRNNLLYLAANGRDHATIANANVAVQIVVYILDVERTRGDLR